MTSNDRIVSAAAPTCRVVDVDYIEGYKLHLVFNDRAEGIVDLSQEIARAPYLALRDPKRFIAFGLEYGTLVWSPELDISPDYLRSRLQ